MFKTEDGTTHNLLRDLDSGDCSESAGSEALARLLAVPVDSAPSLNGPARIQGAVVGVLVGFGEDALTPLVTFPRQPGAAALAARSTLDLHGSHVGGDVVLIFENGDPCRPIILGVVHGSPSTQQLPGSVEVEADGERVVVAAKEQLVLRCGRASITLTKEGKLILRGDYVSSQSSGVLRIRGGSVHIN